MTPDHDIQLSQSLGPCDTALVVIDRPMSIPSDEHADAISMQVATARSRFRTWSVVAALDTVLFVAALDQTVIATAIPTITRSLESAAGYTWIGAAYLISSAVTGPLWSRASDIWGRKVALLASILVFAMASIVAALAVDMPMLIAGRAIQGCACGGIFQLVSITTSDMFSVRERALFFGLQGAVYAIAGSAGPLIGGAFSQYLSWRWCFWINLPFCALSFGLLFCLLDVHNPHTPILAGLKAIDWAGTASLLTMSLLFLLGLEFGGGVFPWSSPTVLCLIILGIAMAAVFVYSEKKVALHPLLPMAMFTRTSTNAIIVLAVAHSMVSIGVEYYLPLYLQSVKQQSPFFSGLLLLPWMITAAATDVASGMIIHRTGRYLLILRIGVCLMTVGTAMYITMSEQTAPSRLIGFEVINAVGIALIFQVPMLILHSTVAQSEVASATSSLAFMKTMGTAMSIVVGGTIFQSSISSKHNSLADAGLDQATLAALVGSTAAANIDIIHTLTGSAQGIVIAAYAWALRNVFIFYTCLASLTILASIFVGQCHLSEKHTETKTGIEHLSKRQTETT